MAGTPNTTPTNPLLESELDIVFHSIGSLRPPLDLYSAINCVAFMSEYGQKLNVNERPYTFDRRQKLEGILNIQLPL